MTFNGFLQILFYLLVLLLIAKPLGSYMARVYNREKTFMDKIVGPIERFIYKICGIKPNEEMNWQKYAVALLIFSLGGFIVVYLLQRLQGILPLNPQGLGAVSPDSSFNTAISFVSNTNWQGYGGEVTMSYLTQMGGLAVQNFFSAAAGMAVAVVLVRGFTRQSSQTIGNFWVDMTRSNLYILLPISFIIAIALVSQGVVQNLSPYKTVSLLQSMSYDASVNDDAGKPVNGPDGKPQMKTTIVTEQVLPQGPAASQIAIKQLGTNGGGFFNTNSAHPYENPTPLSNFIEVVALLLIPTALIFMFGDMVKDSRQGWALIAATLIVFIPLMFTSVYFEQQGNPVFDKLGISQIATAEQSGGNMEGKETRYGIANSAFWAAATTATSCGAVNSMHDSYSPLGGLVPLWLMQLGELIFGGVGSGLYLLLVMVIISIFVAVLMIGRTPEYMGKKIESFEMKMSALVILITPAFILIGTAIAVVTAQGVAGIANPGAHGFSEILYAFTSASENNGSAFGGLSANTPFYNTALGICMLLARFLPMVAVLALAGSLAAKKAVPVSEGSLPTHSVTFILFLVGIIIIVSGLNFFPALVLGPIAELFMR